MANSKKILSWGRDAFLSGIGDSENLSKQLFWKAPGWQLFDFSYPGMLIHTGNPINIDSGATKIVDSIKATALRDTSFIYATSETNGDFYKISQTATSASGVTVLRSSSNATTDGLFFFKPPAGTEYMYYFNTTQIGRWDISGTYPTGWTDNHFTGLQSTSFRPTHRFNGAVYYGNLDRIGKVYDNAGTAANNTNVLDFESDYTVYDIEDDGTYLIININNGRTTRILFWDTFSPSWNKEWVIPDKGVVSALQRIGDWVYAIGADGLYKFNFNSQPLKVRSNTTGHLKAPQKGYSQSKGVFQNAFLWGPQGVDYLFSYGQMAVDTPETLFQPFRINSGVNNSNVTCIEVVSETNIFAAYNDGLFRFSTNSYGATNVDTEFFTNFFDLGDTYRVDKIVIIYGLRFSTDQTITVNIYPAGDYSSRYVFTCDNTVDTTFGNSQKLSFYPSNPSDGAITDYLALGYTLSYPGHLNYSYIKRIDIYGEQVDEPNTQLF